MPLRRVKKGASKKARNAVVSANIRELHGGPRYKANVRKFGVKKARTIVIATAFSASRRRKKRSKK